MPNKNTRTTQILSENLFPVVGVGASAGGLESFKEMIKAIPGDSGMAYILIQHLAPHYESVLSTILQKSTSIPVVEIIDNIKVQPNHIYIIPSNKTLIANDGILLLDPRPEGERINIIDLFLTSLAEIHQEHAIGVVLSGTGNDGTVGLKTIKDQGGITIVQDEESAIFYGMPQSAIDADVVDFILAPGQIPDHLIKLVKTSKIAPTDFNAFIEINEDESFRQILAILRAKLGVDFTYYKQTTIRRRILRRKSIIKIEKLKDYQTYLLENKSEQEALYHDILIPVTAFFRDTKSFNQLCETVFPSMFKDSSITEPVRIWVAGCSSGEEAYSMAICLYEYITEHQTNRKIQIFATDISEVVIAKARSGIYLKKDMAGISETRIKNFFTKIDGTYQVHKIIREMCVFACQNFLKDPPFAKMDLLSCRNVLIYMEPYLQKKAFTTFHYALNNNGFLLLGKSESIAPSSDQFQVFSQQEKIFTRKPSLGKYFYLTGDKNESALKRKDEFAKSLDNRRDDYQKAADDTLLARYATVGVIVNEELNILQFRGSTSAYLEAPPGKASHNILKMAKEGLSFELRNALNKAKSTNEPIKKAGVIFDKGKGIVDIEVFPLPNTIELYFLVIFQESNRQHNSISSIVTNTSHIDNDSIPSTDKIRIEQMEKELALVRDEMRTITEDQEAANEELQSANEELLSGSEELQTLNEELETTKEEIQSSNEELMILNQELLERNEQLIYSRKFAEAIVTTIHEPLIVLTNKFYIKSANKAYYEKFNTLQQQTEGKQFFEVLNGIWDARELRKSLEKILPDHSNFENLELIFTPPHLPEMILVLNARQLINENSNEKLILLAINDITERKLLERNQQQFANELEIQVAERTKELKEANINLHYYNENLQQFTSIASHDLQEPLRKIKTFAAILISNFAKDLKDEGKEAINKIRLSADRMSQLIKEVLEYSKVVHTVKNFQPTDLDLILKNVLKDLDLLVSDKQASINYEGKLPVIDAIPLQINQLFYNLLTNALKFQRENMLPAITISSRLVTAKEMKNFDSQKEGINYLEIEFTDNGIGFDEQFNSQIFQIFERLHSSDEFEGTGIGLALCKKIVENHNGNIFAVSHENEGSSFYVTLPIQQ